MLVPLPGTVLVEPLLRHEAMQDDIQNRISGFLMAKPEYEGIPNVGTVYALPEGYVDDHIKVGARVLFNENQPKGFKFEDRKLFRLQLEQIVAIFIKEES